MNKTILILLLCAPYCYGQIPRLEKLKKIYRQQSLTLNSKTQIQEKKAHVETLVAAARPLTKEESELIGFPALSATRIDTASSSNPQFFYDEYRKKKSEQDQATLLIRAPAILLNQYEASKNPIIAQNPWFVLKGLQELKPLLHALKTSYFPTLSASQLNFQKSKLSIFAESAYKTLCLIIPTVAALKAKELPNGTFGQQWLNASDAKTERCFLYFIATHIVKERLFPEARELTCFIGVLGHALPKDVRMICLNAIEEMCANELFAGTNKEIAQSNFDLVQAVNKDMFHGPDAQTIAEMAIRDRLFTQKTQ